MKLISMSLVSIVFAGFIAQEARASWTTYSFDEQSMAYVSSCSGVYIIFTDGTPYYVGRSRRDISARLKSHLKGTGSRKVAGLLGKSYKLTMAYECLTSVEQMEAQLIKELGTDKLGNLRKETDPADWDD
jgi:predicted GIY-YIG superfamily endonuclease